MNEIVLQNYYNFLIHIKKGLPFLKDIELIENSIDNFEPNNAINIVDYISNKYENEINIIGKNLTGIMVFYENELPQKNDDDLIDALFYVRNCVIVCGVVACGLKPTIQKAVLELKK